MSSQDSAETIFSCGPDPNAKVDVRRLPQLVRRGLQVVWATGRRELALSTILQEVIASSYEATDS
jgi:hypothetical protein